MPTVKVGCRVVNGVMLRMVKPGWDDGTGDGVKPMVWDGPGIRLMGAPAIHSGVGNASGLVGHDPGITEVDEAWMRAWMTQNEKNPLVTMGEVFFVDEDKKSPNPTP